MYLYHANKEVVSFTNAPAIMDSIDEIDWLINVTVHDDGEYIMVEYSDRANDKLR